MTSPPTRAIRDLRRSADATAAREGRGRQAADDRQRDQPPVGIRHPAVLLRAGREERTRQAARHRGGTEPVAGPEARTAQPCRQGNGEDQFGDDERLHQAQRTRGQGQSLEPVGDDGQCDAAQPHRLPHQLQQETEGQGFVVRAAGGGPLLEHTGHCEARTGSEGGANGDEHVLIPPREPDAVPPGYGK